MSRLSLDVSGSMQVYRSRLVVMSTRVARGGSGKWRKGPDCMVTGYITKNSP